MSIKTVGDLRIAIMALPEDLPIATWGEFGVTEIDKVEVELAEPEDDSTCFFRSSCSQKHADKDHADWIKTAIIS